MKPILTYLADLLRPPFRRFTIQSELPSEKARERIRGIVQPGSHFLACLSRTDKLFAGKVSPAVFKVARVIGYGNSFLPVIVGTFKAQPGGTSVEIMMRPTGFTLVFSVLIGCFLVVSVPLAVIFPWLRHGTSDLAPALVPFAMLAAFYVLIAVLFGVEAVKARRLLEQALQPRPSGEVEEVLAGGRRRMVPRFLKPLILVLTIGVAMFFLVWFRFPKSEPYRIASHYVDTNPAIQDELGNIAKIELGWRGFSANYAGPEGSATFALYVTGRRATGVVFFVMTKHRGAWRVGSAELQEQNGRIVMLAREAPQTDGQKSPCP